MAEYLAYMGLKNENLGFKSKDVLRYLRSLDFCEKPMEYLDNLIKFGILTSSSSRLQFSFPTIQEYLAAQYMLQNSQDEVIDGFEKSYIGLGLKLFSLLWNFIHQLMKS